MSSGLAKEDKFEIIAILHGELHKKTKLEILCGDSSVITQLEKIGFERFVIFGHGGTVPKKIQYFVLHDESGTVKFSARFEQTSLAGAETGLSYFTPDIIFFAQQGQNQRFSFLKGYDFSCFGRYKNRGNCSLKTKNISQGGCALIVKDVNARFLYKDVVVKNIFLDSNTFGSLQLGLKVIDVVPINEFDEDSQLYFCHQISCEFGSRNRHEEIEVEKIIIKFLMSSKIRSLQGTVNRMLMRDSDSSTGNGVLAYLTSKHAPIQTFQFEDMLRQSPLCQHQTMVFNIIDNEQACSDIVQSLNKGRFKSCNNIVVIVTDGLVIELCVELLYVEKTVVSTEKSPLRDFGQLAKLSVRKWNPRLYRSQKRLIERE